MTDMQRFRRAVSLTERDETAIRDQSWFQRIHQMDSISETIRCPISEDEFLEEDCQAGGKWEQYVEDSVQQNTAGVKPVEVIRPGQALQIEIAKYFRGQLREEYPPVFDDGNESSDDEDNEANSSISKPRNGDKTADGSSSEYSGLNEDSSAGENDTCEFSADSVRKNPIN